MRPEVNKVLHGFTSDCTRFIVVVACCAQNGADFLSKASC